MITNRLPIFFSLFASLSLIALPVHKNFKYDLSICAIFQDEADYLKEWIEFHKLVGVQHFYLYNNFSKDNYMKVLAPYIKSGEVELFNWPVQASPTSGHWVLSAFNDGLKKAKGKTKWLAFLDLDEFLFAPNQDNLVNFLLAYGQFGAVCANWAMFGTSGIQEIPKDKLTIECLLIRASDNKDFHKHVKSVMQPDYVKSIPSPHFAEFTPGFYQVTASKKRFDGPFSPTIDLQKLVVFHYWSRDEKFFNTVKIPRRQKDSDDTVARTIALKNSMNDVKDTRILRFVPRLRKIIFGN